MFSPKSFIAAAFIFRSFTFVHGVRKRSIFIFLHVDIRLFQGLPGGTGGEEPACQCRRRKRHTFDPWVGKIPWRRKRQPTPVFLPGGSPGQRSLAGCRPRGHRESDATKRLSTQTRTQLFQHLLLKDSYFNSLNNRLLFAAPAANNTGKREHPHLIKTNPEGRKLVRKVEEWVQSRQLLGLQGTDGLYPGTAHSHVRTCLRPVGQRSLLTPGDPKTQDAKAKAKPTATSDRLGRPPGNHRDAGAWKVRRLVQSRSIRPAGGKAAERPRGHTGAGGTLGPAALTGHRPPAPGRGPSALGTAGKEISAA